MAKITVLQNKIFVFTQIIIHLPVSPEEDRPLRPIDDHRSVVKAQRLFEDIIENDTEGDDDENVCRTRERNEKLQRSDLSDYDDRHHDDDNVDSHTHIDVVDSVENIMEGVGDENDVNAAS